ncbi:hypothetical protein I3843_03G032400 [Carya illinoinensis]|uniref:Uncharacterized protein n=1 Tax=Carya illinoinensis TaxID=32201 RepID=A0A8T1QYF4_CARIL|nr:hypothetical protein I3760_03G029400 [Carya illinoinensis]KAG6659455.1 hypothetical protein CIPAW_03G036400 [Carya illinoinensis]KAG6719904.1 hypothetical protein I3842_03G030700 [Carya illinoinensis]KAG7985565.1 hypothetical protein I3843_03G032400 [Carya illinoinensis]
MDRKLLQALHFLVLVIFILSLVMAFPTTEARTLHAQNIPHNATLKPSPSRGSGQGRRDGFNVSLGVKKSSSGPGPGDNH